VFETVGSRVGRSPRNIGANGGAVPLLTKVQNHANATILNNTFARQSWVASDIVRDDLTSWSSLNPTRFVPPVGMSRCRVTINSMWQSNSTGARWIDLYRQGTFIQGVVHVANNESRGLLITDWIESLTPADYLELEFAHSSGVSLTLTGATGTIVAATRVQFEWAP
jgi:hypothetical protein